MLEVTRAVDAAQPKDGDRNVDLVECRLDADLVVIGLDDLLAQRRIFRQRNRIGRAGLAPRDPAERAIDIRAGEDDGMPCAAREGTDSRGILRPQGEHVDHGVRLERPQPVDVVTEVREIAVDLLGRKLDVVLAAVEHHQLVAGGGELANHERTAEPRSAKHEHPHRLCLVTGRREVHVVLRRSRPGAAPAPADGLERADDCGRDHPTEVA